MTLAFCLDTNVLVYAAIGKRDEPTKWMVAHELLERNEAAVAAQALAEFYAITTGPKYKLDPSIAMFWLERLSMMPVVNLDASVVREGSALSRRFQISYWDGAILAAAGRLGATTRYSEDLSHNQNYGAVRVVNPFLEH